MRDPPPAEAGSRLVVWSVGTSGTPFSFYEIEFMAVLKATDLTVRYGTRTALSSLSVEVAEGVSGLLGPNGAGKSTLLKTVLGFLEPARGTVEVLGVSAGGRPQELRLRLGYSPERHVFVPGLTSVETVALAGELGGLARTDALARAHDVLWFTGLGDARYRLVEEFSTGMQQRTKLAIALVHDPDLVLLDEPTSGLDPVGRRQMLDLVRDVGKRKVSVILSTHLLHDVEQVCDSVVVLDQGRLALEGRLDSLRRHPGWAYEVRVREDSPGAFKRALRDHELTIDEDSHGHLRITLSAGDSRDAPSTRFLFEAARSAGAEIRHLRRFETHLEDEFLGAVDFAASDDS